MTYEALQALQRRVRELAPDMLRGQRVEEFHEAMRALLAAYDQTTEVH